MLRLRSFLPVLAGTLMIMAVVLINGRPSVFTDTDDYFIEGRTFAFTIAYALNIKHPDPPPTDPQDIADAQQAAADLHMSHTEIGARSPYYGLLLYATQRVGTIWLLAVIQAAIGAWMVFLLWRTLTPKAPEWTAYAVQGVVAAASTLPFFAGFAMPDVFSGYAVIATALLLVVWERLGRWERGALAVLLGLSITFHASHLLDVLAVAIVGIGLLWRLKAPAYTARVAAVSAAIAAAVFTGFIYKAAVQLKTGDEMRRPPFMAIRITADGPGRRYLAYACDHGEAYALCQFRDLPNTNAQDMMWSDDRKKGIFNVTTFDNRLQMEREEMRFVFNTVLFDPVGSVGAAMRDWGEQLTLVSVDDPLKNPHYYLTNDYWSTTNLPWLIEHASDCGRDYWGCGPRLSIEGSYWLHSLTALFGLMVIGWRMFQPDVLQAIRRRRFDWGEEQTPLVMALALLLVGVLANAFVCGALSGPFARYQARIIWLVVAGGALAATSLVPKRANAPAPGWLERVRATPFAQAIERRIDPAFFRFGMVGTAGFVVHASVLHALVGLARFNAYTGWLGGFAVAVTATWLLNRSFTFRRPSHHGPWRQALVYLGVQGAGAAANFAAYAATIALAPALKQILIVPLAVGAGAGLCLTFLGSKHLAFRPAAVAAEGQTP
jgi:putative flippase GtrA